MKEVNICELSQWMHRNAREIDVARWKCLFEDGSKQEVVEALMVYQNADGGFGNTLDLDNWNTNSLPYATLYAIDILKEIEFYDLEHPIYKGIFSYIDNTPSVPESWSFTVESNQYYPHAIYYSYSEEYNKTESIGIHLGFYSFIIEHYKNSEVYNKIISLVGTYIDLMFSDNLGDMGPSGFIELVRVMKEKNIAGYDYERLEERLKELVNNSIQRDPKQWEHYGYRPSDYIKSKDSLFYFDNKDILEVELDFLADTLPDNDVWSISWSWFDNNEKYPKESTISGMWCKAYKTIHKSLVLRNFGRLKILK